MRDRIRKSVELHGVNAYVSLADTNSPDFERAFKTLVQEPNDLEQQRKMMSLTRQVSATSAHAPAPRAAPPQRQTPKGQAQGPTCRDFNFTKCERVACRYRHVCSNEECALKNLPHAQKDCKKKASLGGQAKNATAAAATTT